MRPHRITVHFGAVRVVVPLTQDKITVADLGKAAVVRYCRATGENENVIRVYRLELSQGGILDWEDLVEEVLNGDTDQILAIYDDGSCPQASSSGSVISTSVGVTKKSSSHQMSTSGSSVASHSSSQLDKLRSPVLGRVRDSVVEITSLENPPTSGLRVSPTSMRSARPAMAIDCHVDLPTPLRSSLRTEERKQQSANRTINRVTMSPEVEKKISLQEDASSLTHLQRSSARKSRLTESFFDAKERLEERRMSLSLPDSHVERKLVPPLPGANPEHTVIAFPDDDERPMGIEVTAIVDDNSSNGKLSAVQILRISDDDRVGLDGRLRVGDNIVEIDGRPVYQMSLIRARGYLLDIGLKSVPTLTVARPISSFLENDHKSEASTSSGTTANRPILSALQQANTQQIGSTRVVQVKKLPGGFGFTVTGRETARCEHLFYIGNVKLGGAAVGLLKAGDRLLKINGESTSGLRQNDVVDRLKVIKSGDTVELEISRVGSEEQENTPPEECQDKLSQSQKENSDIVEKSCEAIELPLPPTSNTPLSSLSRMSTSNGIPQIQQLTFAIPLNDTGSAGLGISLKARVLQLPEGGRQDCGIFVKKLLMGGAAWKDGRLAVDDQLCGIEDVDLLKFSKNSDVSEAITSKLREIGPKASVVRLRVSRKHPSPQVSDTSCSNRITVDGADSTILLDGNAHIGTPTRQSQDSALLAALEHERHASTASDSTRRSEIFEDDVLPDPDAFIREAPGRKSMSEKRGMGASTDPSTTTTFQKIKHQRQTSAPSGMSISHSFHGRSASQRAQARVRSQSVHPREPAKDLRKSNDVHDEMLEMQTSRSESPRRRSKSVEVNRVNGASTAPTVHEMAAIASCSQSSECDNSVGFKNPAFKYAAQYGDGYYGNAAYSPTVTPKNTVHLREKEKQQRRKSMGSTMKNWFRIGSRSRDSSPEKDAEEIKRKHEEEMRTQDRIRARESALAASNYASPPLLRHPRVFSEYESTYLQPSSHNPEAVLSSDSFSVANSRFYCSLGPRSVPARKWQAQPHSTTSDSSTGMSNISGKDIKRAPPTHKVTPIREEGMSTSLRPISQQFRIRTPSKEVSESPLESQQVHRGSLAEQSSGRMKTMERETALAPTLPTTMLLMRGSPIVEEAAWEHDQLSRPRSLADSGSPLLLNPRSQKVVIGQSQKEAAPTLDGHVPILITNPLICTPEAHCAQASNTHTHRSRRPTRNQAACHHQKITPIFPGSKVFFVSSDLTSSDRISMRNSRRKQRKDVRSVCVESESERRQREKVFPSHWHSIPVHRADAAPLPPSETETSINQLTSPSFCQAVTQHMSISPLSSSYRVAITSSLIGASQDGERGRSTPTSSKSISETPLSNEIIRGLLRTASYRNRRVTTKSTEKTDVVDKPKSFSTVLSNWENRASGAETVPSRPRFHTRSHLKSDTFFKTNETDL